MGTLHGTDEGPWAIIIGEKVIWGDPRCQSLRFGGYSGQKGLGSGRNKRMSSCAFLLRRQTWGKVHKIVIKVRSGQDR